MTDNSKPNGKKTRIFFWSLLVPLACAVRSFFLVPTSILSFWEEAKTKTNEDDYGLEKKSFSSSQPTTNVQSGVKSKNNLKRDESSSSSIPPSQMPIHYHEMWNHSTSTIQVPEKYQNPFDEWIDVIDEQQFKTRRPKRTSLEILQEVLHGERFSAEFEAVEAYAEYILTLKKREQKNQGGQAWKENLTVVHPPKCLLPDMDSTRALTERVTSERKKGRAAAARSSKQMHPKRKPGDWPFRELTLPLPIFNVGFPKAGTSTLHSYFGCIGLESSHGLNPLGRSYNTHVYTQLDRNVGKGSYPQISLLDELHETSPNATMVFIFRPIFDWIRSAKNWNGMGNRFGKFLMPGLVMRPEQLQRNEKIRAKKNANRSRREGPLRSIPLSIVQLAKWWCGHVLHIREYTKEYPSHALIELDLYDRNGTSGILHDLFGIDTDAHFMASSKSNNTHQLQQQCWGHKNYRMRGPDLENATISLELEPMSLTRSSP